MARLPPIATKEGGVGQAPLLRVFTYLPSWSVNLYKGLRSPETSKIFWPKTNWADPSPIAHLAPAAQCCSQPSIRNKSGCPKQEEVKQINLALIYPVDWNNLNQPVISSRHWEKIIFKASLERKCTSTQGDFPACPICTLFNEHICIPSCSLSRPETLYNLITDTSLQFQIPTLCQIPISCCLIPIHLLLFLLLLPFPAWTSSSPASCNFLRKAPHRVLLESEPLLHASG